jgi:hypothetical protein
MKFSLILTFAGLVWVQPMIAQEPAIVRSAEIADYGIYRIELTGKQIPVPSTGAGVVDPVSSAVLIAKTDQIPAIVGTTFGMMFILNGTPAGAEADVDIIVQHPAFKKSNGETTGTLDKVPWHYGIGKKVGYTYTFDEDWEAVPGKWTIEIRRGGKTLVAKDFIVKSQSK